MINPSDKLQNLANRAKQGDAAALAELRKELAPSMVHLVRQALRAAPPRTSLDSQVHAAVRPLRDLSDLPASVESSMLENQLAQRLCSAVCGRVRAGFPHNNRMQETVRA